MADVKQFEATDKDFSIAFNAIRASGVRAGVDVNTPEMSTFIEQQAEIAAGHHAHERASGAVDRLRPHEPSGAALVDVEAGGGRRGPSGG